MAAERKLEWLEAMRGLAALWVVVHHAGQSVEHFFGELGRQPWILRGYLGVDFFFVLSGFIIAFASQRLLERGGGVKEYLAARLVRIYIPYLPAGIGVLALLTLAPSLSAGSREISVLTSLTLLPGAYPPALSVAWTLVHEMIFYAVYSLWFVERRLFRLLMGAWVASILWVAASGVHVPYALEYVVSPMNLCFFAGVAVFHLSRRGRLRDRAAAAIALVGMVLVASQVMADTSVRLLMASGFVFLVVAGVSDAAAGRAVWRPLVTLGAASYAVYLVHNPVLSLAARLLSAVASGIGPWPAFLSLAVVATAGGLAYWRWYERPALAWVRARILPRAAPPVTVPADS